ncbi:MAG: NAD-dependent epimerase/dehydratase family protein [Acidobacteriota bacterium]
MSAPSESAAGRVLIAGYGYIGSELGLLLAQAGWRVWALRRGAVEPQHSSIHPLQANLLEPSQLGELPAVDAVVYLISADRFDEEAYLRAYRDAAINLHSALEACGQRPPWLYASSTGVYGTQDGSWVDEDSAPAPTSTTGRALLRAEEAISRRVERLSIVRFGGLYGPGRTRLIDQVRRGEGFCVEGPPRYTNRLHRRDAAGFLAHLLTLEESRRQPLYLGVDEEPADRCEVLRFLADALGVDAPAHRVAQEPAPRGNKRCRNRRLVGSGFRYRYPSFRQGYSELIAAMQAEASAAEPS